LTSVDPDITPTAARAGKLSRGGTSASSPFAETPAGTASVRDRICAPAPAGSSPPTVVLTE
ncbi:hypothetical protein L345_16554, partial [Ophiophagus hannah]